MKKIYVLIFITALLSANTVRSQNIYTENFDDVPGMIATGGWVQQNNSVPLGTEIWHNGVGLAIDAFNGAPDSYAEVSFQSTDENGSGTISNWLISPTVTLNNGDVVSFYTTSYNNDTFPDRLQLRLNPSTTTVVGSTATSVGDFTVLLVEVNPNLTTDTSQYPENYWGHFTATINGLPGTTDCRLAFRYFVTDGGGTGANSSTIGVDALTVDMAVGIDETTNNLGLNLYPNPVSDRITIDFAKPLAENGKLLIYNSIGKIVTSFSVSKGQTKASFGISSLAAGTYSLVLNSPDTVAKKNFIKE